MSLTKSDGYLIVESNYRVYAYTSDELQLSILNTFTDADGAFADMIMTVITRNSVRRAFELGITAAQIVAFMRSNSHPLSIEKFGVSGCVPQTIIDQVGCRRISLMILGFYRFNCGRWKDIDSTIVLESCTLASVRETNSCQQWNKRRDWIVFFGTQRIEI